MNALVYVNIDQCIYKEKMKVALNEKQKKLCGFSFSINIANFEAFLSVFKLTKNLLFLKSGSGIIYTGWVIVTENLNLNLISHPFIIHTCSNQVKQ